MKKINLITSVFTLFLLTGCQTGKKSNQIETNSKMEINSKNEVIKADFGTIKNGDKVNSFTLKNSKGMEVEIIEYGAIVKSIKVPDKNGEIADVVLGYDDLSGYINDPYYFGATIGRVANRIGGAKVVIDGITYKLSPNTLPDFGRNSLHGGVTGYNKVLWKGETFKNENEVGVILTYLSKDGEEGYPGNVTNKVTYTLNDDNELQIVMEATTDKTTFVNMTHHGYFNLSGEGSGNVLNTKIMINADKFTPSDDDLIPTGELAEVKDLPVDFSTVRSIASQIDDMQMEKFKGYDLNYVLNHVKIGALGLAAKAIDPVSGRKLEVFTTQPCMHFYTSNFLEGKPGKGGNTYEKYGAFCFEPQGFPDAPHHKNFQSVELNPGNEYKQTIIYKLSVKN